MTLDASIKKVVTPWHWLALCVIAATVIIVGAEGVSTFMRAKRQADRELATSELRRAIVTGRFDRVRSLVESGADVNVVSHGGTVLSSALWSRQLEMADYLLNHGARTDLDQNGRVGSLLYMASRIAPADEQQASAQLRIVQRLIRDGEDVNAKSPAIGYTPLIAACQAGTVPVVKELLDHGAAPNTVEPGGNSALHFATDSHSLQIVRLLVRSGADPRLKNKMGETALHLARVKQFKDIELTFEQTKPFAR